MIKEDLKDIFAVKNAHDQFLANFTGVTGIYTGIKRIGGKKTGTLAIVVVVKEKKPLSQLKPEEVIPKEIEGFPTDVIVGAIPQKLPLVCDAEKAKQNRLGAGIAGLLRRPLVGGAQIMAQINGQYPMGTLGCFVQDQNNNYYFLTNQHAVGPVGNVVYQPLASQSLEVGTVTRSIINQSIDAAIVEISTGVDFLNYVLRIGSVQGTYNLQPSDVGNCIVQKTGITTGHTFGTVEAIDFTVVDGNTGITMTNQIKIEDIIGMPPFSQSGDSGSVVMNDQYQVVGLMWGGIDNVTDACPIAACLSQLGVSMVLDHYPPLYVVHNGSDTAGPSGTCNFASLTNQWSTDAEINPFNPIGVENSPGIAAFNNRLYNIRQGRGGNDVWCQKFDGAVWGPDVQLAPTSDPTNYYKTSFAPGMASYYGELHGVKQGENTDGSMWWFHYSADDWSTDQRLSLQTAYAPSLVVYKGVLYCFHTDISDGSIHYSTYDWNEAGEGFFSDNKAVPSSDPNGEYPSNNSLSAIVFNGKIYCFHTGQSTDSKIYCFTFDGTTWSDDQPLAPAGTNDYFGTWDAVQAIPWNNSVYCFFIGTNRSDVWYCTGDLGNWSTANAAGFQSWGQVALGSIPTFRHVDFDIAPDVNNMYVIVEGSQFTLNLASPNQWIQVPGNPGDNVPLGQIDCQSLFSSIYALDYSADLYVANLATPNQDWGLYPVTPPKPFARICGLAGSGGPPPYRTADSLFALDVDGTLYCSLLPNGAWQTDYPSPQPAKFYTLASIPQNPNTPGYLFAIDVQGALWMTRVPGGNWSNTSVPQPPVPFHSISAIQWVLAMSENGPIVQTNLYALDTAFNFWGCVLGQSNWVQNYPSAPPVQLAKLFPSVAFLGGASTYAADTNGNFYTLNVANDPPTFNWKTNYPTPLPQPD